MIEYLTKLYDENSDDVCVLYKYYKCSHQSISLLKDNKLWFSNHSNLNDPFDCLIRLPSKITQHNINIIKDYLKETSGFSLKISDDSNVSEYIGQIEDSIPLENLALMALQFDDANLLQHIKKVELNDIWIKRLFELSLDIQMILLNEMTVFCVSENPNDQLLWGHYGDSHKGFCVGYVCPVGILNPQLIHKLTYTNKVPMIDPIDFIIDPYKTFQDLILTKPVDWKYECEWRLTLGNMPGLNSSPLPIKKIIFGERLTDENEKLIKSQLAGKEIVYSRVEPNIKNSKYSLVLRDEYSAT